MRVVNMFGGSSVGKSTNACRLFAMLKDEDVNVELVREFVKEAIWEGRMKVLGCQLKISGEQLYRQHILSGKVDIAITDSPILLGAIYESDNKYLKDLLIHEFNKFNNINILLQRVKPFNPHGRTEKCIEESIEYDKKIQKFLDNNNIPYHIVTGDRRGCIDILKILDIDFDDNLYRHQKEGFEHDGYTFKYGERYVINQDEHYVYLTDSNKKEHGFTYEEAGRLLSN